MLNWQALIGHIYKFIECGSPKHHVVVVLWTFCVYVIWEGPKFLDWRGGLDVGQEKKQAEVQNAEEEEQDWTLDRVKSRQRSKTQRKKSKIVCWTREKAGRDPKCREGKAGLDVERERKQAACGCLLLIQK